MLREESLIAMRGSCIGRCWTLDNLPQAIRVDVRRVLGVLLELFD